MKILILLVLVVAVFAGNNFITTDVPANVQTPPPALYEFYWDDGTISSCWGWVYGGNYWAVQFDEEKTGGVDYGEVTSYGAATFAGWPDDIYQGCYMHTFADNDGEPGADLGRTYLGFDSPDSFNWVDTSVITTTAVFYIAFEQYDTYPLFDSIAVDAEAGTHNWTGYYGIWGNQWHFGDFMIRCYWNNEPARVENTSWGSVKALY